VTRLLANGDELDGLGIVIVDEFHWIGEQNRGYLLEILLSKLMLHNNWKKVDQTIQIVGMSATIPNLSQLAFWLQADLYETDFRPIPLQEYIKVETMLYNRDFHPIRQLNFSDQWNQGDNEGVTEMIWNIVERPKQNVLVFCSTKHWCEVLAKLLAKNFRRIMDDKSVEPLDQTKLDDVIEQLRRTVSHFHREGSTVNRSFFN
jgi:DNA polymerase theta